MLPFRRSPLVVRRSGAELLRGRAIPPPPAKYTQTKMRASGGADNLAALGRLSSRLREAVSSARGSWRDVSHRNGSRSREAGEDKEAGGRAASPPGPKPCDAAVAVGPVPLGRPASGTFSELEVARHHSNGEIRTATLAGRVVLDPLGGKPLTPSRSTARFSPAWGSGGAARG
jgi:hypothetical protein